MQKILTLTAIALYITPVVVSAQSVATAVGLLNICIGVLFTASCLVFMAGMIYYLFHAGMPHRDHGLEDMHRGVVMLVMVAVLMGFARLLQSFFT